MSGVTEEVNDCITAGGFSPPHRETFDKSLICIIYSSVKSNTNLNFIFDMTMNFTYYFLRVRERVSQQSKISASGYSIASEDTCYVPHQLPARFYTLQDRKGRIGLCQFS